MLGEEEGLFGHLTGHRSEQRSDRCGQVARSGGSGNLSFDESEFLRKRNPKEGREWMMWLIVRLPVPFIGWSEAPDAFYTAEEGGEMVSWRRNGWRRVELFNASVLGRREERVVVVLEGERSMRGSSWFAQGGVTRGCSSAVACGYSRQPKLGGVWIVLRCKTTSWACWSKRLFGMDTIMEIKQAAKMEWAGKERFLGRNKIMEKNLGCCHTWF
jgi:hypothetical protein